jgi:S1-C subfamily serine protease
MLSTAWLSAFAPVGGLQASNQWAAFGAGVFFHRPPLLWLVTANHVVDKVGPQEVSVLVTGLSGNLVVVEVGKILAGQGLLWVRDQANDLAASPVPSSPEFGIKAVAAENCLPFAELVPSMPCFTIGCPYGLRGVDPGRATPLILDGVIAAVDQVNRRIYTSAPTFPGNSGGPLIAIRSPFTPGGTVVGGRPTVLLAGIMLQSALVPSPEPGDPTPPLHLGVAVPADVILDLLNSDQAKALVGRIGVTPT